MKYENTPAIKIFLPFCHSCAAAVRKMRVRWEERITLTLNEAEAEIRETNKRSGYVYEDMHT